MPGGAADQLAAKALERAYHVYVDYGLLAEAGAGWQATVGPAIKVSASGTPFPPIMLWTDGRRRRASASEPCMRRVLEGSRLPLPVRLRFHHCTPCHSAATPRTP
jgi:hypothetical protein